MKITNLPGYNHEYPTPATPWWHEIVTGLPDLSEEDNVFLIYEA